MTSGACPVRGGCCVVLCYVVSCRVVSCCVVLCVAAAALVLGNVNAVWHV
jgi:hypothetical protein